MMAPQEAETRPVNPTALQDEFLRSISHEIRTPLTVVLGIASTLEKHYADLEPKLVERLCRMLTTSARKLEGMLSDLVDLDRLRRGTEEPLRRPTDVGGLARMMASESALYADRRLTLDLDEVVAAIDAAKVERIIEHLLTNAARHTPPGTRVWLRIRGEGDGVRIEVDDAGPPIPPEQRAALLEPFRHGDEARDSHRPGLGIGLALVDALAKIHGGSVQIGLRPGGGNRFTVILPG